MYRNILHHCGGKINKYYSYEYYYFYCYYLAVQGDHPALGDPEVPVPRHNHGHLSPHQGRGQDVGCFLGDHAPPCLLSDPEFLENSDKSFSLQ